MEGKIYTAIANVMKDVGAVGKDDTNPNQHYKYRGIDAVMNALNPAMVKNQIFVVPEGLLIYSIIKVKYTFYTTDGSSVECVVIGEAMDSGDKSMNKAMSAAFKYACFQTFCIPTEEMQDTEASDPEPTKDRKKPTKPKTVEKEQNIKSDKQKNAELIASVDSDQLPDDNRTQEYRIKRLKEEMERTGKNEATILKTAGVKTWDEITDVKFIKLMGLFSQI